jgi:hypothetical protein
MTTSPKSPITFRAALTRSLAHWTFWLTCLAAVFVPSILAPDFADFGGRGGSGIADTKATNVPEWTADLADQFPGCKPQKPGEVTAAVVVVLPTSEVRRMTTDAAYAINADDERANNVWVVGTCN